MLNQNIVLYDVITSKEAHQIMLLDGAQLSSKISKYCKANKDKYLVILNTWLLMWMQYTSPRAVQSIKNRLLRKGLIPVIEECSNLASDIIKSDFTLSDLGDYGFLFREDPRICLQLLRFPKRFSPSEADLVREQGLRAFRTLNFAMKGDPKRIIEDSFGNSKIIEREIKYPKFLIEGVKRYVSKLLHDHITECCPLNNGRFSNGVTADGCRTMYEKYLAFFRHALWYQCPWYYVEGTSTSPDLDYVKAVAVPKNYKTPRIIAEVSAYTQYHMQGIRECLVKSVKTSPFHDLIVFDDQRLNQEWSRIGSIAKETYCTIDLTSASDSISEHLAKQLLPQSWYDVITAWNPPFIMMNGKKYERNIFLTSGSGETFGVESVIFLAIALYATEVVKRFTKARHILAPRVFGDDIICDYRVFDTLCDFLEMLLFTVNKDKSFNTGSYRESCGAEWWCGLDTATKYFPRRAFNEDSSEYLEGLVSLQHRLYEFELSEQWLTKHIQSLFIKRFGREMTQSLPGTECTDLWADFPYYHTMYPPFLRTTESERFLNDHEEIRREAHTTLVSRTTKKDWNASFEARYGHPHTSHDDEICEMFRYVDFLRHGTPLDDFGIPIHRQPVSDDQIINPVVWTTLRR